MPSSSSVSVPAALELIFLRSEDDARDEFVLLLVFASNGSDGAGTGAAASCGAGFGVSWREAAFAVA